MTKYLNSKLLKVSTIALIACIYINDSEGFSFRKRKERRDENECRVQPSNFPRLAGFFGRVKINAVPQKKADVFLELESRGSDPEEQLVKSMTLDSIVDEKLVREMRKKKQKLKKSKQERDQYYYKEIEKLMIKKENIEAFHQKYPKIGREFLAEGDKKNWLLAKIASEMEVAVRGLIRQGRTKKQAIEELFFEQIALSDQGDHNTFINSYIFSTEQNLRKIDSNLAKLNKELETFNKDKNRFMEEHKEKKDTAFYKKYIEKLEKAIKETKTEIITLDFLTKYRKKLIIDLGKTPTLSEKYSKIEEDIAHQEKSLNKTYRKYNMKKRKKHELVNKSSEKRNKTNTNAKSWYEKQDNLDSRLSNEFTMTMSMLNKKKKEIIKLAKKNKRPIELDEVTLGVPGVAASITPQGQLLIYNTDKIENGGESSGASKTFSSGFSLSLDKPDRTGKTVGVLYHSSWELNDYGPGGNHAGRMIEQNISKEFLKNKNVAGFTNMYEASTLLHAPVVIGKEKKPGHGFIYQTRDLGKTLDDKIRDENISQEKRIIIARDFIRGIANLNNKEILHRDLKPQNVMITESDKGAIFDFDRSTKIEINGKIQNSNNNTVAYNAPECTSKVKEIYFSCVKPNDKKKRNDGRCLWSRTNSILYSNWN